MSSSSCVRLSHNLNKRLLKDVRFLSTNARTNRLIPEEIATIVSTKSNDNKNNTKSKTLLRTHEENENKLDSFTNIFKPLPISEHITPLKNRIIMGSMHSGLEGNSIPKFARKFLSSEDHGDDLTDLAYYLAERAAGGVGLIVTGGISPNYIGGVGPFASKLSTEAEMEEHKVVTSMVHEHDTKICLQVLHAGRYSMHPLCVAPSAVKSPISPFKPRAMSESDIQSTISDYVNCAYLAKAAGYDGVEIMGSEGYLIHQFLVTHTNHRTDAWGGDFSNRMKFPLQIVQGIRQAVGNDFLLIFRLSMIDLLHQNAGLSWEEVTQLAQALEQAGVHIINTGIGWHESRIPTIATSVPRGGWAWVTKKLKDEQIVSIPLCATNRFNDPHTIEKSLQNGDADLVSMARPFLADSNFIQKIKQDRVDEINTCIGCNQACLDHVFVGKVASCLVNPRACHERELPKNKTPHQTLNIAVVGAGPAGLAFTVTAAKLGHKVTLFDKSDEIGGQFNMAKRVPGKEEFHETLRYYNTKLKKYENNVTLSLGTDVTHDRLMSQEHSFDRVVISTGVTPRVPSIPGLHHPKVVSYIDVLKNNATVGNKVAIIGAGGIGFDVAEFLLHPHHSPNGETITTANDVSLPDFIHSWDIDDKLQHRGGLLSSQHPTQQQQQTRDIYLLQRKQGKVGANLGKTTGWIHRSSLKKGNVHMMPGCTYDKVDDNGDLHITVKQRNGDIQKEVLHVDNIVLCAGQISLRTLEQELLNDDKYQDYVFTVGGAYEAGELDAKRAIDMATRLAYKIGDDQFKRGMEIVSTKIGDEEQMIKLLSRFAKKI